MGATYTRQSTYSDGDTITAAHSNDEFNQLLAAFASGTGHTHDGTTAEGGPITKLLGTAITIGDGTTGTDIAVTFDGETNDGVLTWMEDEDHFKFSDDVVIDGTKRLYFNDEGGEYIHGDGTDLNLVSGADINIPANIGLTFGDDGEKIEGDGTDLTITGNNINLTATADVNIPSGVGLTFATAEKIESDGTDLTITVGSNGDINIPANIGLTFGDDGEKIEGDGTDLTITGNNINLTATADVVIPADVGITFGSGEKIEGDNTDLTITSGAKINLTATSDVHIPNNVGIVFGGDSEKIEGDGTDLTISANNLTVDAVADIILDAGGANIIFKDGGTSILDIANNSTDVELTVSTADKNFKIKGTDGSSAITALDIDMALAGKATFNGDVVVTGDLTITGDDLVMGTNTAGHILVGDDTNFNPVAVSGDISMAANGAVTIANTAVESGMLNANVITGQSELGSADVDSTNDDLLIHDADAGALKKVSVANLVSSAGGITEISADSTPQLGGNLDTNSHNILIDDAHFIADENGNEQIIFQTTSSAVNQIDVTNAATGNAPEISATGGDTNVSLKLTPKGSGQILIDGNVGIETGVIDLKNGGSQSNVKFYCESSNAHYVQLQAPAHSDFSGNVTATLPNATGTLVGTGDTGSVTNGMLAGSIAASKLAGSIGDSKLSTISTAGKVELGALEIDGASDIGADLADADLIIVDDGAGGTEVKSELTRVKKYIYSAMSGDATASDSGAVTIANDAVESGMLNDNVISGQTELASGLATTDELLVSDGGTIKRMDVSVLQAVTDDSATALAIALG